MTEHKDLSDSESSDEGNMVRNSPEPSAPPMEDHRDLHDPPAAAVATPIPPDDEAGSSSPSSSSPYSQANASGIAAGFLGLLLGGPLVALIFGGGAAWAATTRSDAAGDAARSLGDVALTARDRAVELDEKHHITDKSREAAGKAWTKTKEKASEMEEKHHLVDRAKGAANAAYRKAAELNEEHHIVERAAALLGSLWAFVSSKIWGEDAAGENSRSSPAAPPTQTVAAPTTVSEKTSKAGD